MTATPRWWPGLPAALACSLLTLLARRCTVAWLYDQLALSLAGQESVLLRRPGGGFTMAPAATLHMFISTAPCGDARLACLGPT